MSTALSTHTTPYSGVNPLDFIKQMGSSIARSQMFGCETEAQGQVFAMACLSQRCDPLTLPQTWHVMHGRLTMRADAMLGRLSAAGGTYTVIQHTPDVAEIEVQYKGRKFRERLTWEEARLEPFVYDGKPKEIMPLLLAGKFDQLKISTNYATPRRRGQHLWARVCSDAVRVVAPDLVTGVYTPTELVEITGKPVVEAALPGNREAVERAAEREAIQAESRVVDGKIDGEVIDASFTIVGGEVQTQQPAQAAVPAEPVFSRNMREKIDQGEVDSLKQLVREVSSVVPGIGDKVGELFRSQGMKFADLSWESARQLRASLERKELEGTMDLLLSRGE